MPYSLKVSEKCLFYLNILYIKKVFDSTVFVFIILSSILIQIQCVKTSKKTGTLIDFVYWFIDKFSFKMPKFIYLFYTFSMANN